MIRHFIPLAVCIVVALGCTKKKVEDTHAGGGGGGGTPEPAPSGLSYTITIRKEKAGDHMAVLETLKGTTTTTRREGERKETEKKTDTERFEYTESIIELPAGTDRPTKFTRAYKVAEEGEGDGPPMSLSYAGKTVFFDKRDDGAYAITADGKPLPPDEEKKFQKDLDKPGTLRTEDAVPKKPVKLSESWALPPEAVKQFAEIIGFPFDTDKSKLNGKLTKVYAQGGKQWGTLEFKFDLVVEGGEGGTTTSGKISMTITIDTPIDGSSSDEIMKIGATGKVTNKRPDAEVEIVLDLDSTETRTTVK